ncbi:MAG: hypothetical protein ACOC4I_05285 [Spirochaetota bacterium]
MNTDRILFTALLAGLLFGFFACNDGTSASPPSAALQGVGDTEHPPPGSDTRVDPSERTRNTAPSIPEPERVASSELLLPVRENPVTVVPSDIEIGPLAAAPLSPQVAPVIRFVEETLRRLRDGEAIDELVRQERAEVVRRRVEAAVAGGYRPQQYLIGVPGAVSAEDLSEIEVEVRVFRGANSTVGAVIVGSVDQGLEIVDIHVDFEALGNTE